MLRCNICLELKDESLFYKNVTNSRGLSYACKTCDNERRKKWRKQLSPELRKFKNIYNKMKQRCNDKNDKNYYRYGGRGIKCERSLYNDFYKDMYESYIEHVNECGLGMKYTQLDRIDNDGPYCKNNCRWVTAKENNHYNHAKEFYN